jgi:hypothetical protein
VQKLARSEEEDVVGNYFKPQRATRLMAQAQETQKAVSKFKGTISCKPVSPHVCMTW